MPTQKVIYLLTLSFSTSFFLVFTTMSQLLGNISIHPVRDQTIILAEPNYKPDQSKEDKIEQRDPSKRRRINTTRIIGDNGNELLKIHDDGSIHQSNSDPTTFEQNNEFDQNHQSSKDNETINAPMKSTNINVPKRPPCFDDPEQIACRYDEVGKYLEQTAKFTIIHKPSDAIPAERRIPKEQGGNVTYIAQRRAEASEDGSLTPIVEYNPSLVPLTSDMDPKLLDYLTGRYHDDISDEEADKVKYLSVARGTNFHSCGNNMRRMDNPTREYSYLSLSLLDDDLQPIPGASGSVGAARVLFPWQCYQKFSLETFQDFQIIAARSTKGNDKKDQLFMATSDIKTFIFPLDIRRVPAPTNDASEWDTKLKGTPVNMIPQNKNQKLMFYGRGLQVRFMDHNAPEKNTDCGKVMELNTWDFRKNYHIFETERDGAVQTHMEIRPHGRRSTRKINFYSERFHNYTDWELVPNGTINKNGKRYGGDIMRNNYNPQEQWKYQFEEKTEWKDRGLPRGTACCIDLVLKTNETVKVGISHSVSKERGYVSRFYAFETNTDRFNLTAISGPFCFGGMSENDINANSQIFPFAESGSLRVANETYSCPSITFASGITDYQANTDYAVISYGVNDCFSKSIVIPKDVIREFLNLTRAKNDGTLKPATKQLSVQ